MASAHHGEAVHAVGRVVGECLDFDAVTRAMGRPPSEVRHAGDIRPTGRPVPQDVWMLDAPLAKSEALDSHLRWLRGALLPAYEFLRAWMRKSEISIYCGLSIDDH